MFPEKIDVYDTLYLLCPMTAPIWAMVSKLNTIDTYNPKFAWMFNPNGNTDPVMESNYCQIFVKSLEITPNFSQQDINYLQRKKSIELLRDFENVLLYGRLSSSPHHPCTGGIFYFANIYSTIGAFPKLDKMTEYSFKSLLREVFKSGGTKLMVRPQISLPIDNLKMQIVPPDKSWGISMFQYLSPYGTLNVIVDPMLNCSDAVIFDISSLTLRTIKDRACYFEKWIEVSGVKKARFVSEWGLESRAPQKTALMGRMAMGIPKLISATLDEILGLT